jgi:molecular chaperone DnaK (HSP70)
MLKTLGDPLYCRTEIRSCGLDFGTSNSTVSLVRAAQPRLVPLEGDKPTIPSAEIKDGDMFGSVGKGLGLDAYRKFR